MTEPSQKPRGIADQVRKLTDVSLPDKGRLPQAPEGPPEPERSGAAEIQRRTRRTRPEEDTLYIRGPKAVMDALRDHQKQENFRCLWAALEDVLIKAGKQVGPF